MLIGEGRHSGRLSTTALGRDCPPAGLLSALAEHDDPVFLDSSALHSTYGRYSVLTCRPLEVLTLRDGLLTNRAGDVLAGNNEEIWQVLRQAFSLFSSVSAGGLGPPGSLPYPPGWFGYVGYEVGRHVERLPGRARRDTHLPDLRLGFHDAVAVYDALKRTWSLNELVFDSPPERAGLAAEALRDVFASSPDSELGAYPVSAESADAGVRPIAQAASHDLQPHR